jgi:hypothetical protein
MTYKIIRFYEDRNTPRRVIKRGLTLEEAKEYCEDSETSSRSARALSALEETMQYGPWFDGYEPE